jgi:hypothetical protein
MHFTAQSLANHASRGTGPEYQVIGKKVYYRPSRLLTWLEKMAGPEFKSTTERSALGDRKTPA